MVRTCSCAVLALGSISACICVPTLAPGACAGAVFAGKKVVLACGPWAQPVLESLCGLTLPLQVWQTTVMYFKAAAGVPDAGAKLAALPVLIDYNEVPLWTSTSAYPQGRTPGRDHQRARHVNRALPTNPPAPAAAAVEGAAAHAAAPPVYSCPCSEFPGLIKFAVHQGVVVTADTRYAAPPKQL